MRTDFEYIVIGLGGLGSAAAYWLSRRVGPEVLAIDQFEMGHVHGESQDHSRMIRFSYHTPDYVRLALQASECWSALEAEVRETLVVKTGGLDLYPESAAAKFQNSRSSLEACNVP